MLAATIYDYYFGFLLFFFSLFKMKTLCIVLLICDLIAVLQARTVLHFQEEWHLWKAKHEKNYSSDLEELEKHLIWLSNKKYIEAHNAASDIFGYTLELNKFADLVNTR